MSTSLEKLDNSLFQPLAIEESAMVLGGAATAIGLAPAGRFTYIGMTNIGGNLERDHEWDEDIIVAL